MKHLFKSSPVSAINIDDARVIKGNSRRGACAESMYFPARAAEIAMKPSLR